MWIFCKNTVQKKKKKKKINASYSKMIVKEHLNFAFISVSFMQTPFTLQIEKER